jgi:hypothetical protein
MVLGKESSVKSGVRELNGGVTFLDTDLRSTDFRLFGR